MKYINFPAKKSYEQDILDIKWKKLFTFSYDQASIEEYHEYISLTSWEQISFCIWELQKHIPNTFFQKVCKYFWFSQSIERKILTDFFLDKDKFWIFLETFLSNKFRKYTSIFEWINTGSSDNDVWIYNSNVKIICTEYNISWPLDLFKNYTLEQYYWMLDGILFESNKYSKEWKWVNKQAIIDKQEVKRRAEETKKAFESLKK